MKKIFLLPFLTCIISNTALPQKIGDILKRKAGEGAKQATQNGVEKTTDKIVDKTLDKVFTKKDKNNKPDGFSETKSQAGAATESSSLKPQPPQSLKTYTKYDFVPGEKIIGYDAFENDAVGDFPSRWATNASGEIMKADNFPGKWLNISKQGYYVPDFIKSLPENFTIEYDILFIPAAERSGPNTADLAFQFINKPGKNAFDNGPGRSYFEFSPYMSNINIGCYSAAGEKLLSNEFGFKGINRNHVFNYHVAVWRQKARLRVYLNETKAVDIPSLMPEEIKYNTVRFSTSLNNDGSTWLIGNFKFATGLADTRNRLLTEGKFSTTGILFDVNAYTIKPASYGTLKEIAAVLKENEAIQIKITGHTDSDGEKNTNIDLSKRRADAVKAMLAQEFGIAENRMVTDGKGASQPVSPNTNAEGKAQNRRVEFVKL